MNLSVNHSEATILSGEAGESEPEVLVPPVPESIQHTGLSAAIRPTTRLLFGETLGNPGLDVLDVPQVAALAHDHGLPLLVDSTFTTPYLMKPFEHGDCHFVAETVPKLEPVEGLYRGLRLMAKRVERQAPDHSTVLR